MRHTASPLDSALASPHPCWQIAEVPSDSPVGHSEGPYQVLRVLVAYPDGSVRALEPRLLEKASDELGVCDSSRPLASCWTTPAEWPTWNAPAKSDDQQLAAGTVGPPRP